MKEKQPKTCTVCGEPQHAKGLCSKHYALNRAEAGAMNRLKSRLLCCQINPESEIGRQWFVMPGGKSFPHSMAEYLIAKGSVRPAGDGLFGDSQSYRVAP